MYAIVNGLKLFYHKEGSGRPVILLHGNGEDHTIFDVAIRDLARSYTVYALDSRAHGKSDPVPSLTYREMAGDVAAFIRQQGLEKPRWVGFSGRRRGGAAGGAAAGPHCRQAGGGRSQHDPHGHQAALAHPDAGAEPHFPGPQAGADAHPAPSGGLAAHRHHRPHAGAGGEKDLIDEGQTRAHRPVHSGGEATDSARRDPRQLCGAQRQALPRHGKLPAGLTCRIPPGAFPLQKRSALFCGKFSKTVNRRPPCDDHRMQGDEPNAPGAMAFFQREERTRCTRRR